MNDWDDYRFVLALDRAGTVRGAAALLGVTHSTVSRRLAVINTRYTNPVMERVAGGYRKTEFGKRMVDAAEQMEAINYATDRQRRAAETDLIGPITLSIANVLAQHLLLGDLAKFQEQYPGILLVVQSNNAFANLDHSEADVVVRGTKKPPEHLVGRRLFPYALNYYCHVDYLKQNNPENRRWITGLSGKRRPEWIAESPFPDAVTGLANDDINFHYQAAIEARGMIRSACYICDPDPRLMRLPNAPAPMPVDDFWVLTHPDMKDTPRIKLLMRFLVGALKAKQDLIEGKINPDENSPS